MIYRVNIYMHYILYPSMDNNEIQMMSCGRRLQSTLIFSQNEVRQIHYKMNETA